MQLDVLQPPSTQLQQQQRTPLEIVAWAISRFRDRRLVVSTGFGMEGCVLVDMLWRAKRELTVHYLDTHFLFPETHALRKRIEQRYPGLALVNAGTTLTPDEQALRHGNALWTSNPDLCCELRKVVPMRELLRGADAWMTGLRRTQSPTRAAVSYVEWDAQYEVVKINPLAGWSREEVWEYAVENGVPYNELHERGYPSIGCTHCTQPVEGTGPSNYTRLGRWPGTEKTECGLHRPGTQVIPSEVHLRQQSGEQRVV